MINFNFNFNLYGAFSNVKTNLPLWDKLGLVRVCNMYFSVAELGFLVFR